VDQTTAAPNRGAPRWWIPVVTPMGVFHSKLAAARCHKRSRDWIDRLLLTRNSGFRLASKKEIGTLPVYQRLGKSGPKVRPVITPAGMFPSPAAAACAIGLPVGRVYGNIRYGRPGWAYV